MRAAGGISKRPRYRRVLTPGVNTLESNASFRAKNSAEFSTITLHGVRVFHGVRVLHGVRVGRFSGALRTD